MHRFVHYTKVTPTTGTCKHGILELAKNCCRPLTLSGPEPVAWRESIRTTSQKFRKKWSKKQKLHESISVIVDSPLSRILESMVPSRVRFTVDLGGLWGVMTFQSLTVCFGNHESYAKAQVTTHLAQGQYHGPKKSWTLLWENLRWWQRDKEAPSILSHVASFGNSWQHVMDHHGCPINQQQFNNKLPTSWTPNNLMFAIRFFVSKPSFLGFEPLRFPGIISWRFDGSDTCSFSHHLSWMPMSRRGPWKKNLTKKNFI